MATTEQSTSVGTKGGWVRKPSVLRSGDAAKLPRRNSPSLSGAKAQDQDRILFFQYVTKNLCGELKKIPPAGLTQGGVAMQSLEKKASLLLPTRERPTFPQVPLTPCENAENQQEENTS